MSYFAKRLEALEQNIPCIDAKTVTRIYLVGLEAKNGKKTGKRSCTEFWRHPDWERIEAMQAATKEGGQI